MVYLPEYFMWKNRSRGKDIYGRSTQEKPPSEYLHLVRYEKFKRVFIEN